MFTDGRCSQNPEGHVVILPLFDDKILGFCGCPQHCPGTGFSESGTNCHIGFHCIWIRACRRSTAQEAQLALVTAGGDCIVLTAYSQPRPMMCWPFPSKAQPCPRGLCNLFTSIKQINHNRGYTFMTQTHRFADIHFAAVLITQSLTQDSHKSLWPVSEACPGRHKFITIMHCPNWGFMHSAHRWVSTSQIYIYIHLTKGFESKFALVLASSFVPLLLPSTILWWL